MYKIIKAEIFLTVLLCSISLFSMEGSAAPAWVENLNRIQRKFVDQQFQENRSHMTETSKKTFIQTFETYCEEIEKNWNQRNEMQPAPIVKPWHRLILSINGDSSYWGKGNPLPRQWDEVDLLRMPIASVILFKIKNLESFKEDENFREVIRKIDPFEIGQLKIWNNLLKRSKGKDVVTEEIKSVIRLNTLKEVILSQQIFPSDAHGDRLKLVMSIYNELKRLRDEVLILPQSEWQEMAITHLGITMAEGFTPFVKRGMGK
ncbi:MAG: hypothetical protein L3J39_03240 [Verrucomicrobiales bacterium]|nr:hypothetical protein [Verrucomicrobiales bacterium]